MIALFTHENHPEGVRRLEQAAPVGPLIGLRIPVEMEQKGLDYSEYGLSLSGEEWMEAEPEADSK
jgi:hypothetical protein